MFLKEWTLSTKKWVDRDSSWFELEIREDVRLSGRHNLHTEEEKRGRRDAENQKNRRIEKSEQSGEKAGQERRKERNVGRGGVRTEEDYRKRDRKGKRIRMKPKNYWTSQRDLALKREEIVLLNQGKLRERTEFQSLTPLLSKRKM